MAFNHVNRVERQAERARLRARQPKKALYKPSLCWAQKARRETSLLRTFHSYQRRDRSLGYVRVFVCVRARSFDVARLEGSGISSIEMARRSLDFSWVARGRNKKRKRRSYCYSRGQSAHNVRRRCSLSPRVAIQNENYEFSHSMEMQGWVFLCRPKAAREFEEL